MTIMFHNLISLTLVSLITFFTPTPETAGDIGALRVEGDRGAGGYSASAQAATSYLEDKNGRRLNLVLGSSTFACSWKNKARSVGNLPSGYTLTLYEDDSRKGKKRITFVGPIQGESLHSLNGDAEAYVLRLSNANEVAGTWREWRRK